MFSGRCATVVVLDNLVNLDNLGNLDDLAHLVHLDNLELKKTIFYKKIYQLFGHVKKKQ